MRLRPRHYVLIAIILALGVYNLVRLHRARERIVVPVNVAPTPVGPIPQSPAWAAYDKAAGLRDAPDAQFQAALHNLKQQISSSSLVDRSSLSGCQTWLLFYRQSAVHASANDPWKQRSTEHVNSCVSLHRDAGH
ncbi:MAG TPA: hypothetical protein VHY48_04115 [Acidobacteriaceae bacterium]|jgi:hypothetical protein|nr:hypothetical protein [Acidobacteriaceae bacterium]